MDTVNPTNSTKYFTGRSKVPGEPSDQKVEHPTATLAGESESLADQVDLSKSTKELLADLKAKIESLDEEFPQHAHRLPTDSEPLHLFGTMRTFLRNPENGALAQRDPSFRNFYTKVENLGAHMQQVMSRMREEARSNGGATYHGIARA